MYSLILFHLAFLIVSNPSSAEKKVKPICNYIDEDTKVHFYSFYYVVYNTRYANESLPGNVFQDNCITDIFNETYRSVQVECPVKNLPQLGQYFVNNIKDLKAIIIKSCGVKNVLPKAFFNVSKVIVIDLSGNNLFNIPAGIFNETLNLEDLYLQDNKILTIEDRAFSGLRYFYRVNLTNNLLTALQKNWFTGSNNVEFAYFSNNSIQEIPSKMFQDWSGVHRIYFKFNSIKKIHERAFDVGGLVSLDLSHNKLTSISKEIFSPNMGIVELDLRYNLLNNFPLDILKDNDIKAVLIQGNPFKCRCLGALQELARVKCVRMDVKYALAMDTTNICSYWEDVHAPTCWNSSTSPLLCDDGFDAESTRLFLEHSARLDWKMIVEKCDQ